MLLTEKKRKEKERKSLYRLKKKTFKKIMPVAVASLLWQNILFYDHFNATDIMVIAFYAFSIVSIILGFGYSDFFERLIIYITKKLIKK